MCTPRFSQSPLGGTIPSSFIQRISEIAESLCDSVYKFSNCGIGLVFSDIRSCDAYSRNQ
jgi:hypothetical protein